MNRRGWRLPTLDRPRGGGYERPDAPRDRAHWPLRVRAPLHVPENEVRDIAAEQPLVPERQPQDPECERQHVLQLERERQRQHLADRELQRLVHRERAIQHEPRPEGDGDDAQREVHREHVPQRRQQFFDKPREQQPERDRQRQSEQYVRNHQQDDESFKLHKYYVLCPAHEFRMPKFNPRAVSAENVQWHLVVAGLYYYTSANMQKFFSDFESVPHVASHIGAILDSSVSCSLDWGVSLHYVMLPLLEFINDNVCSSVVDVTKVVNVLTMFTSRLEANADDNWLSRVIALLSNLVVVDAPSAPMVLSKLKNVRDEWTVILASVVGILSMIMRRKPGMCNIVSAYASKLSLIVDERLEEDNASRRLMNVILEACGLRQRTVIVPEHSMNRRARDSKKQEAARADDALARIGPGGRHDNDHVNIADMSVMPSINELLCGYEEYLPRNAPTDTSAYHHLPIGASRLIDINFRLFRQDALIGLRDALVKFLVIDGNTTPDKWNKLKGKHVLRSNNGPSGTKILEPYMIQMSRDIARGISAHRSQSDVSYDELADIEQRNLDDGDEPRAVAYRDGLDRIEVQDVDDYSAPAPARIKSDTDLWLYHDAKPIDVDIESRSGVTVYFEFADVPQVSRLLKNVNSEESAMNERQRYWEQCGRLMDGSLVIVFSYDNSQLRAAFTVVSSRQRLLDGRNQVGLVFRNLSDLEYFSPFTLQSCWMPESARPPLPPMILIQTTAYWKAYEPVLEVIKGMTPMSLPNCLIGPMVYGVPNNQRPEYIRKSPVINLSCLARPDDRETAALLSKVELPVKQEIRELIVSRTSLDDSQTNAVLATFDQPLAVIQGPPGCGKTYVGGKIVQAIIDTYYKPRVRVPAPEHEYGFDDVQSVSMPPILCVCYTNHALDSFLLSLFDAHVLEPTNVCRLGRQTTEKDDKRLNGIHFRHLKCTPAGRLYYEKKMAEEKFKQCIPGEHRLRWEDVHDCVEYKFKDLYTDLETWVSESQSVTLNNWHIWTMSDAWNSWIGNDTNLNERYISKREEFVEAYEAQDIETSNRYEIARRPNASDLFDQQSGYGYAAGTQTVSFNMSQVSRMQLVQRIVSVICANDSEKLVNAAIACYNRCSDLEYDRKSTGAFMLQSKYMVAMTTGGAAINIDIVKKLKPRIIFVEEGAECQEAHILALLSPETEHLIMIGDHKQLRPSVSDYRMDKDCKSHALDLNYSLFERVVEGPVPPVTLQYQHRMRPEVADLTRAAKIYQNLYDHESVTKYPPLKGFKDNVIFIDHNHYEGCGDAQAMGRIRSIAERSHVNLWEARMVAGMTSYLLRQGYIVDDNQKRVTILTPYVGQLLLIKSELERLGGFRCAFTEGDVEKLAELDEGLITEQNVMNVTAKDVRMKCEVRVATVDNYQGEEADVVVLSTVTYL